MSQTSINIEVFDFLLLLKLGNLYFITKHFCLGFVFKLPVFYLCYTDYFGLLIFCCQNVAKKIITEILYNDYNNLRMFNSFNYRSISYNFQLLNLYRHQRIYGCSWINTSINKKRICHVLSI